MMVDLIRVNGAKRPIGLKERETMALTGARQKLQMLKVCIDT